MWRWTKRLLFGGSVLLVLLVAVLLINTVRYSPADHSVDSLTFVPINTGKAAQLLSRAVQFETDSSQPDEAQFQAFLDWLPVAFPGVHREMTRELISGLTPVLTWTGRDPDAAPVLIAAHYDVVSVPQDSIDRWEHPPYQGAIADGYVWGRGTLDNKGAIIAILSAAESLIEQGKRPKQTVIFSIGHDEEVLGKQGAAKVVAHLQRKGVTPAWSLDEGSFILNGIVSGLSKPVASINVAEKGFLTLTLAATGQGGHSSMPPTDTATSVLAEALVKLQRSPVPGGLTGVTGQFFDSLGRHFDFGTRILFANRWLFDPLLERVLSSAPATNATLRTTTAPTMLQGSPQANVLPTQATAQVNFRLHPRDNIADVIAFVKRTINDDRVVVSQYGEHASEASAAASPDSAGYRAISWAIGAVYTDAVMVPGLTIAATDSHHYAKAVNNAYRINPFKIGPDDLARFHGVNERLSVENLRRGIQFYTLLFDSL